MNIQTAPVDAKASDQIYPHPFQGHQRQTQSKPIVCSSGYIPRNAAVHRAINLTIGTTLFLLTLPLFLLIALVLVISQGPGVFYRGDRLGRNRKVFQIYKFRTLDTAKAAAMTAHRVLPKGVNIETPLGKYLRASRLDELPQLLNIIKGDMNIIGPRPVRLVIAQLQEIENPHYKIRYGVRPGLIGQTQAYMGHGTSKRLRSKLNYMFCLSEVKYTADLGLILRVGYEVVRKSVMLILAQVMPGHSERVACRPAQAHQLELVSPSGTRRKVEAFYGDTLRLTSGPIGGDQTLMIRTQSGGLRRARVALTSAAAPDVKVISPVNENAQHLLSRYLLNDPVVPPSLPKVSRTKGRLGLLQRFKPVWDGRNGNKTVPRTRKPA